MNLQDILRRKGAVIHTIGSQATLDDVVQKLVQHNCGSLVVCDSECDQAGSMVGIITERDILRACARHGRPLTELRVADHMSRHPVTGTPEDSLEKVMGVMTEKRIRHLPVIEADRLVGMISIGDIVKAEHSQLTMENHYLKSYLHG
jgi:CBS domain-containing protein